MGRPKALPEPELLDLLARHLARFPGSAMSAYEMARALGLPRPAGNGRDRMRRALQTLEEQGRAVRVTEPADEHDGRPVTRWKLGAPN